MEEGGGGFNRTKVKNEGGGKKGIEEDAWRRARVSFTTDTFCPLSPWPVSSVRVALICRTFIGGILRVSLLSSPSFGRGNATMARLRDVEWLARLFCEMARAGCSIPVEVREGFFFG